MGCLKRFLTTLVTFFIHSLYAMCVEQLLLTMYTSQHTLRLLSSIGRALDFIYRGCLFDPQKYIDTKY
jgi:hypothetical protein